MSDGEGGDGVGVGGVDLRGGEALLAEPLRDALRACEVVVGEHDALEQVALRVAARGDRRHALADAAGAYDQCLHLLPPWEWSSGREPT